MAATGQSGRLGSRALKAAVIETFQGMPLEDVAVRARRALDEIERAVVGKRDVLKLALSAHPPATTCRSKATRSRQDADRTVPGNRGRHSVLWERSRWRGMIW
jgi:hypothetical protein